MSKLKEKSEFNIYAAELLIENAYFAPSVHCSYYSCFQLLKFTINDFFGIDYDSLASKISSSGKKTHQFVIGYVASKLVRYAGREESRKFKRTIKDLKQFREESDYDNIEIGKDKGETALRKAKEIRNYLKTNFHV
ncbi:MAG: HEPN domain-containing protein [Mariniphaga sp.]|nr:HEPN domain-containing protein [Mariniphaga sp.]